MPAKEQIKLALCIPSAGTWTADFGISFTQMCIYMSCNLFFANEERNVILIDKRTSLLPRSRQECIEDALNQDCTHALFVDTDQVFPQDTAHQLIRWRKKVVACNVALKTMPSFPTARARGASPYGVPITTNQSKRGLERVWRVGSGIMLIDLSIMKAIPKPWFEVRYSKEEAQYVGEDWHFLSLVEAAGHDIYIDHDLSRQIGHVGQFNYTHINVPNVLEMPQAA